MSEHSPNTSNSARALVVMFGLVALLAIGLVTLSWHASLLDRYEFRQLQTALSTYWIAEGGCPLAYPAPLVGPPWSVPMEFPTYQVMVAAVHHLTGLPLEQTGRLIGIIFLFAGLPALYDLLSLAGLPPSRRLVVLALVLSSPVYLFYARTFMIETTALCFAVWFLALYRRALESPHWGWIAATTLMATLAALTKITTFLVFRLPPGAPAVSPRPPRRTPPATPAAPPPRATPSPPMRPTPPCVRPPALASGSGGSGPTRACPAAPRGWRSAGGGPPSAPCSPGAMTPPTAAPPRRHPNWPRSSATPCRPTG